MTAAMSNKGKGVMFLISIKNSSDQIICVYYI